MTGAALTSAKTMTGRSTHPTKTRQSREPSAPEEESSSDDDNASSDGSCSSAAAAFRRKPRRRISCAVTPVGQVTIDAALASATRALLCGNGSATAIVISSDDDDDSGSCTAAGDVETRHGTASAIPQRTATTVPNVDADSDSRPSASKTAGAPSWLARLIWSTELLALEASLLRHEPGKHPEYDAWSPANMQTAMETAAKAAMLAMSARAGDAAGSTATADCATAVSAKTACAKGDAAPHAFDKPCDVERTVSQHAPVTSAALLSIARAPRAASAYTCHLRFVLQAVAEGHLPYANPRALFDEGARRALTSFMRLSGAAAGLLARLLQRKGPWFRTSTFFAYAELVPFNEAEDMVEVSGPDSIIRDVVTAHDGARSAPTRNRVEAASYLGDGSVGGAVDSAEAVASARGDDQLSFLREDVTRNAVTTSGNTSIYKTQSSSLRRRQERPTTSSVQATVAELIEAGLVIPLDYGPGTRHPAHRTADGGRPLAQTPAPHMRAADPNSTTGAAVASARRNASTSVATMFATQVMRIASPTAASDTPTTADATPSSELPDAITKQQITRGAIVAGVIPPHLEQLLSAVECCFTVTDVRAVLDGLSIRLSGAGAPGRGALSSARNGLSASTRRTPELVAASAGSPSAGARGPITTRDGMLALLRSRVLTTRTMFGGYLPLGTAVRRALMITDTRLDAFGDEATAHFGSPGGSAAAASRKGRDSVSAAPSPKATHENEQIFVVRINPVFIVAARVALSVFYLTTATASLSSGHGTGTWSARVDATRDDADAIGVITQSPPVPPSRYVAHAQSASQGGSMNDGVPAATDGSRAWGSSRGNGAVLRGGSLPKGVAASGSKYADTSASSDSFLQGTRGSGGLGAADGVGARMSADAPGLLHIFRMLDFVPYTPNAVACIFTAECGAAALRMQEAAHAFREQVDATGIFGAAAPPVAGTATELLSGETARVVHLHIGELFQPGSRRAGSPGRSRSSAQPPSPRTNAPAASVVGVEVPIPPLAGLQLIPYAAILLGVTLDAWRQAFAHPNVDTLGSSVHDVALSVRAADVVDLVSTDEEDTSVPTHVLSSLQQLPQPGSIPPQSAAATRRLVALAIKAASPDAARAGHLGLLASGLVPLPLVGVVPLAVVIRSVAASMLLESTVEQPMEPQRTSSVEQRNNSTSAIVWRTVEAGGVDADTAVAIHDAPPVVLAALRASLCASLAHVFDSCAQDSGGVAIRRKSDVTEDLAISGSNMEYSGHVTNVLVDSPLAEAALSASTRCLPCHPWLHQLSSAAMFTTLVWEAVDPLERGRRYVSTLPLLLQLVSMPYMPHRCARWWSRLALNLSHLHLDADALDAGRTGLASSRVRSGDRLALVVRTMRLARRMKETIWGGDMAMRTMTSQPSRRRSNPTPTGTKKVRGSGRKRSSTGETTSAATSSINLGTGMPSIVDIVDDDGVTGVVVGEGEDEDEDDVDDAVRVASICTLLATGHDNRTEAYAQGWQRDGKSDPDIPLLRILSARAAEMTEVGMHAPARRLAVDCFVNAPLNRVTGERSRFISDRDIENDGAESDAPYDSLITNVTDSVCASFGWVYPDGPARGVFVRPLRWVNVFCDVSLKSGEDACVNNVAAIREHASVGMNASSPAEVDAGECDDDVSPAYRRSAAAAALELDNDAILEEMLRDNDVGVVNADGTGCYDAAMAPAVDLHRAVLSADIKAVVADCAHAPCDGAVGGIAVHAPTRKIAVTTPASHVDLMGDFRASPTLRVSVEELCLERYGRKVGGVYGGGWRGTHCEGDIIHILFAVLLWDVLFPADSVSPDSTTPIERSSVGSTELGTTVGHSTSLTNGLSTMAQDTFLTPYQDAPLDLDSPAVFFANRAVQLGHLLGTIAVDDTAALVRRIGRVWRANAGRTCRGVHWDRYPLQLVQLVAIGLGGRSLAIICSALAFNRKQLSGGMPDLLMWRVTTPFAPSVATEGGVHLDAAKVDSKWGPDVTDLLPDACGVEVALVEVKGPRDRLSEKQHVWLRVLLAAGIDARVCKVSESASARGVSSSHGDDGGRGRGKRQRAGRSVRGM